MLYDEILSRAHNLKYHAHDILSRAHNLQSNAHDILSHGLRRTQFQYKHLPIPGTWTKYGAYLPSFGEREIKVRNAIQFHLLSAATI